MKGTNSYNMKIAFGCLIILLILAVLGGYFLIQHRTWAKAVVPVAVREIPDQLSNPDRGGYYIYLFHITDEEKDYETITRDWFAQKPDPRLALVEFDIQAYAGGRISETGLQNINSILSAASETNKHLILRFFYDVNGKASVTEPRSINTIFTHMEQVRPLLERYQDSIFTLQGLFIGNWGEMHGSRFNGKEDMRLLAKKLAKETPESIFLAVRTPQHWRNITQYEGDPADASQDPLGARIGIFNDGMLGNVYDTGTYGGDHRDKGYYNKWVREEEIGFLGELCRQVPLGGEVIINNPFNDFENAVNDFRKTHVTYLNLDYDAAVWKKWEDTIVQEPGIFQGMNGKDYMIAHLGYRFVLRNTSMVLNAINRKIDIRLKLENIGFAPAYDELNGRIRLTGEENTYDFDTELLNSKETENTLKIEVPLNEIEAGDYRMSFALFNSKGHIIELGNESEQGFITIGEIKAK